MKKLFFILLLIISQTLFAQHKGAGACKFKLSNSEWLGDFKNAEQKDEKLTLIVGKIIEDANYLSSASFVGDIEEMPNFDMSACTDKCTMRFVLIYGNTRGLILDLTKYPPLEEVLEAFTSENITKIELNEKHDRNIYGVTAKKRSGIILHTDDKELKKKVRRTLRDIEKEWGKTK